MSGRDVVAGVLVAAAVAAWLMQGADEAFATTRTTALVVAVLGVAACLVSGWWVWPVGDPWVVRPLAALGLLAAMTTWKVARSTASGRRPRPTLSAAPPTANAASSGSRTGAGADPVGTARWLADVP